MRLRCQILSVRICHNKYLLQSIIWQTIKWEIYKINNWFLKVLPKWLKMGNWMLDLGVTKYLSYEVTNRVFYSSMQKNVIPITWGSILEVDANFVANFGENNTPIDMYGVAVHFRVGSMKLHIVLVYCSRWLVVVSILK